MFVVVLLLFALLVKCYGYPQLLLLLLDRLQKKEGMVV